MTNRTLPLLCRSPHLSRGTFHAHLARNVTPRSRFGARRIFACVPSVSTTRTLAKKLPTHQVHSKRGNVAVLLVRKILTLSLQTEHSSMNLCASSYGNTETAEGNSQRHDYKHWQKMSSPLDPHLVDLTLTRDSTTIHNDATSRNPSMELTWIDCLPILRGHLSCTY